MPMLDPPILGCPSSTSNTSPPSKRKTIRQFPVIDIDQKPARSPCKACNRNPGAQLVQPGQHSLDLSELLSSDRASVALLVQTPQPPVSKGADHRMLS